MVKRINSFKSQFILLWIVSICTFSSNAQFTVKLIIKNYPSSHTADSIFIAGNFNQWNPHSLPYQFNQQAADISLVLKDVPANFYEYKLTRGSWDAVEANSDGSSIQNRLLHLVSDTTIELSVQSWQDDFSKPEKIHTASVHVSLMDSFFAIPQLGRTRKIWLYLPEGYAISKKKYPVLYMHDGQNIFDNFTAPYGEWGVDECLDSLVESGRQPSIVVGIENDSHRMNEYNPCNHDEFGKGEGNEYVDFIATTLKPYIDKHYRTLSSKENTIIAGSSMGGLISYFAMLKYPNVFAKAGVFSPSIWAFYRFFSREIEWKAVFLCW
jgi:enterochelin esterase-like enzyme